MEGQCGEFRGLSEVTKSIKWHSDLHTQIFLFPVLGSFCPTMLPLSLDPIFRVLLIQRMN